MELIFFITAILSGSALAADTIYNGMVEMVLNNTFVYINDVYFSGFFGNMHYIVPIDEIGMYTRNLQLNDMAKGEELVKLGELEKLNLEKRSEHLNVNKKRIILLASAFFVLGNIIRVVVIIYSKN